MTQTEKTMKKVKDFILGNGISIYAVSKNAGIPYATALWIKQEKWNPQADTLIKLEKFIKSVKIEEVK